MTYEQRCPEATHPDVIDAGLARPRVVVSGSTASGKTTLADAFAGIGGLVRVRSSDFLLADLGDGDRPRDQRLKSWLDSEPGAVPRSVEADRRTDLWTWVTLMTTPAAAVVESVCLPLLLPPVTMVLTIGLAASEVVRAERLSRLVPGLTVSQARLVLRRKDSATRAGLHRAWGVDPAALGADWRSDLVLCCPDSQRCSDPAGCLAATRDLAMAAYRVYCHYLCASTPGDAAAAVGELRALIALEPARVTRRVRLLIDARGPFTAARWSRRLAIELGVGLNESPQAATAVASC